MTKAMKKQASLIFGAFVLITHLGALQSFTQNVSTKRSEQTTSIREILEHLGNKYNYYFTLESGLINGDHTNSLEGKMVNSKLCAANVLDSLRQLRELIPHFAYKTSPSNPKIIFIYDDRLIRRKNYGLVKVIAEFSYDGTSTGVIRELERMGIFVTAVAAGVSTEPLMVNLPYTFHIRAKNLQVRDILTNSIRLENRHRILWRARTELTLNKKTYIRY